MNLATVAVGSEHFLCIDNDMQLWACGSNGRGELGVDNSISKLTKLCRTLPNLQIKSVSCGFFSTSCVDINGTVWSFGGNFAGQLGLGDVVTRTQPARTLIDVPILYIQCGYHSTLCLDENHCVWGYGQNADGQLGLGHTNLTATPTKVPLEDEIVQIDHNGFHSLILTINGEVMSCGWNASHQLGIAGTSNLNTFTRLQFNCEIVGMACGRNASVFLSSEGEVYHTGQTCRVHHEEITKLPELENIERVYAADDYAWFISQNGDAYVLGTNSAGRLGLGVEKADFDTPTLSPIFKRVQCVGLGPTFAVVQTATSTLVVGSSLVESATPLEGSSTIFNIENIPQPFIKTTVRTRAKSARK